MFSNSVSKKLMRQSVFVLALLGLYCASAQAYQWDNTPSAGQLPTGLQGVVIHRNFVSPAVGQAVGYNIYLPPNYYTSGLNYPVLYHLHGQGNTENTEAFLAGRLDAAIVAGQVPPMIMVFPNGCDDSFYGDSWSGATGTNIRPVERTIMGELISTLEQTYHIARGPQNRAMEGFSMGGQGANLYAQKYPLMFCSLISYASGCRDWASMVANKAPTVSSMFNNTRQYYEPYSSWNWTNTVQYLLQQFPKSRMVIGDADSLYDNNKLFLKNNARLGIPVEFIVCAGTGHDISAYYSYAYAGTTLGVDGLKFHAKAIAAANTPRILAPDPGSGLRPPLSVTAISGQPFSFQLTASNNPTSWSATPLPSGLTISSTGLISGTPVGAAGTTFITVKATNAVDTGVATVVFEMVTATPTVTIANQDFSLGRVGYPYIYQMLLDKYMQGGGPAVTYSGIGLPSWLSIQPQTGAMGGTPVAGTYTFTLRATNGLTTSTQTHTLVVVGNTPPTWVVNATATQSTPFSKYNLYALATDDAGEPHLKYTWSATARPAGAPYPTFASVYTNDSKSNSVIFYAPGTYTLSVTAVDLNGGMATSTVDVNVAGSFPVVTVGPNDSCEKGVESALLPGSAIAQSPATSIATYAWTCTNGPSTTDKSTLNALIATANTPTLTFPTSSLNVGDYTLQLTATDNLGVSSIATGIVRVFTLSTQHITGLTLARSPSAYILAMPTGTITLTATPTTSYASPFTDVTGMEYRFWNIKGGVNTLVQDWSTSNTATMTDLSKGVQSFYVEARLGTSGNALISAYAPDAAVGMQAQTISLTGPTFAPYTPAPYAIQATASSGLPVTLTLTAPITATANGLNLTFTQAAPVSFTLTQAGDADFLSATPVNSTFYVIPGSQTITFDPIADQTLPANGSQLTLPLTATASSGLPVQYTTQGPVGIFNGQLLVIGSGLAQVTANQFGDNRYGQALPVTRTFMVNKAPQTINFAAIPNHAYGDATFNIFPTATSGLPLTFIVTGPATFNNPTVTITGVGDVSITAKQAGNTIFAPAPDAVRTFTVSKRQQTISFVPIGLPQFGWFTYGRPPFDLQAFSSSGLPVSFSVQSGPATLNGNTATITGAGTITFVASQPGDQYTDPAPPVSQTVTFAKANQTITFPAVGPKTFGDPTFALTATCNSGAPVTYTVDSGPGTIVNLNNVSILGAGDIVVRASVPSSANYNAAPDGLQTIHVAKADQFVLISPMADREYTETPITLDGYTTSSLPVTYQVQGPAQLQGNQLYLTGVGQVTITLSANGDANYNPALSYSVGFLVTKKSHAITFPAIADATYGDAPIVLTATSSLGLAVTYTVDGPATESGGLLTITGAGSVTVTASNAGSETVNAAQASRTFTVNKAAQTITFAALGNHQMGDAPIALTATASSGLTVTYAVSGPATLNGSTLTLTGAGDVTVTASQAGDGNFSAAAGVSRTFTVSKVDQTITFNALANATPPVAPITLGASASSGLAVSYTVSGPATLAGNMLTVTGEGVVTVTASQAGDGTFNAAADVVQSFTVAKLNQSITFGALSNATLPVAQITLGASASSGLAVSYSVSGPASLAGNTLTVTGDGVVTVTASQAGNATYNAAADVVQSFTVSKQNQSITFGALNNATLPVAPITLGASASSGLAVSYTVTGPASLNGNTLTVTTDGTIAVTAHQAGDGTFNAAADVTQSFVVSKASQTITFAALSNQTYGVAPITLSATASSGLAVSFSVVSGPATIAGNTLTITGAGSVSVQATQPGDATFSAAAPITRSFTVSKASQTITFGTLSNRTYSPTPFALSATTTSGLPVSFSVTGPATLNGNQLTMTGVGTVSVTASQTGDANYNAATVVTRSFTVSKASQTITFATIATQTYGTAPITLAPTSTSGLPVTLTVTVGNGTVVSLNGYTMTIVGAGSATIVASQAGDANYNAGTSVTRSFTVNKAAQTITFTQPPNKIVTDAPFTLDGTASSGLPVSYNVTAGNGTVVTMSGNTVTIVGGGSATIQAVQAGNGNYNAATSVSRSFTVTKLTQTITFAQLPNMTYGDAPFTVNATASSGLAVTYSIVTGAGTVANVSGNTVTLVGAGTCKIRAAQAGNNIYSAATNVDITFTVAKLNTTTNLTSSKNPCSKGETITLTATVSAVGPTPSGSVTLKNGSTTLATVTVNASGVATCSYTTPTTAGTYTLSANYAGTTNFNTSTKSISQKVQ